MADPSGLRSSPAVMPVLHDVLDADLGHLIVRVETPKDRAPHWHLGEYRER